MLFVTLHGGKPGTDPRTNNVHAYDKNGAKLTSSVLDDTEGVILSELRGIYLVGEYLYVVNANKQQNSLLCYRGSGVKYAFVSQVVSRESCPGIMPPFDLALDGVGNCYLSSQDTNVVTRLTLTGGGKRANPAPLAPALPAQGKFSPGTFVASSVSLKPATTPVPPPAGLEYSEEGEKKHSVRGVVWANGALYVADQPARCIKVYDGNGKFLGQSSDVETPVHLLAWKGSLYVSGANRVLAAKLPNPPGNFALSPIKDVKVKNSCGMAFSDSGHLYVASRTENVILKFDSDFKPMKFRCELPDNPEFLLHV
jgi:hypothetical protein